MQGIRRLQDYKGPAKDYKGPAKDYKGPAKDYKGPNLSFPQPWVFHNSGNYRLKDYKSQSSIIKFHRNSAVSIEKL